MTEAVLSDAIAALAAPRFKSLLSAEANYWGLRIQNIFPLNRPAVFNINGQGVGDVEGDPLPGQCCGLVNCKTDVSSRSGIGRNYVPFPSEEDNDIGTQPTPGYLANLALFADFLYGPIVHTVGAVTVQLSPVLYSRKNETFTAITGKGRSPYWATLRRRSLRDSSDPIPG